MHLTFKAQNPICIFIYMFTSTYSQRMMSTNTSYNQWLSLAKTLLKVALDGRNRSLVARTNKCGWVINKQAIDLGFPS